MRYILIFLMSLQVLPNFRRLKCTLLKVDAAFLMESIRPVYSDISSTQRQKEVDIMNFLQDFLQEIEDSGVF